MKHLLGLELLAILGLLFSCKSLPENLLTRLDEADLEQFITEGGSAFLDHRTGNLTLTFNPINGEPTVRIPLSSIGWPTDWTSFRSLQYTFQSSTQEAIALGFSAGKETKFFITEPLQGIRIFGVVPFEAFVQTTAMTPLRPLGYKVWPQRLFSFENVTELVFKMRYPNQPSQFILYNLSLREDVPDDDILDRRPLIDRYGQWIPETWPDKALDDDHLRALWSRETVELGDFPFCSLGGDPRKKLPSTGFFRTAQSEGRWILVDPHGHPFYSSGMDLVSLRQGSFATDVTGREFLFQELPPTGPAWLDPGKNVSFYVQNILHRHGEQWQTSWAAHIVERLRAWGFNTIGNWSDRELAAESGMPYVLPLSGWTTQKVFPFPYDFPDVFSEEFENNCDAVAKEQVAPLKDDPNLIGWFLGNEPHWARTFGALLSWPEMLLADPEPSATKSTLLELLDSAPQEREKVLSEFLYVCAEKYFETVTQAVRRYDPNHLVLGIRFAERPGDRWAEMSRIFDVFSINIYSSTFRPDPEIVRHYSEVSGKPVLIGEFTAGAPGRGLQGLFYFVHKVRDQEERGKAFRYYVENCAADPHIVGAHWFQLVDDLPTGRPSDEERMNYGFLNVIDLPYPHLIEASRATHRRLYQVFFTEVEPYSEVPEYN